MKKILFFLLLTSCTDPTYLKQDPNVKFQEQEKVNSNCSIKFKKSEICIDIWWDKKPSQTEMGSFYFKTYRQNKVDGSPVLVDLGANPKVVLWMPSMNHGSRPPVQTTNLDTGTFKASPVFFIMSGPWEIRFQIIESGQVADEAILDILI